MDNLISVLFLSFIIGIGFFLKNELTGTAHFKHIKKFILITYSMYVLLTAVFISKSIPDGIDTMLFGACYGLFGAMIWRVYKDEQNIAKLLMYYILLIPLRLISNLVSSWNDGFFSIIGTNMMMHTMLLVAILGVAIVKKHYMANDLVKVTLGVDVLATLFVSISSSSSVFRIPITLIFLVILQLPFVFFLRVLYLRFIVGIDVDVKMDSVRSFVETLRIPWLSDKIDQFERLETHDNEENEEDKSE